MKRLIFHVDMDAFFAAVEQRDNPSLRGKPVIIGAQPGQRGVVSTASYEARTYGVGSAMPVSQAYARCPQGVFLTPSMERYSAVSKQLMEIFSRFTPLYEPLSIDEAFLDMTGTERLFGTPMEIAQQLSETIQKELRLTGSVGVAPNKLLAKIASDVKKPAGITITPFEQPQIREWLAPLPIRRLWGIGPKSAEKLARWSVQTIGDLQQIPEQQLVQCFGKAGEQLCRIRFGIDHRTVHPREMQKSIGREHTFQRDEREYAVLHRALLKLTGEVAAKARSKGMKGRTITFIYRESSFQRRSYSKTMSAAVNGTYDIFKPLERLFEEHFATMGTVRLIGLSLSGFDEQSEQLDLFAAEESPTVGQWKKSDTALDMITQKFGKQGLFRGSER